MENPHARGRCPPAGARAWARTGRAVRQQAVVSHGEGNRAGVPQRRVDVDARGLTLLDAVEAQFCDQITERGPTHRVHFKSPDGDAIHVVGDRGDTQPGGGKQPVCSPGVDGAAVVDDAGSATAMPVDSEIDMQGPWDRTTWKVWPSRA